MMVPRNGMVGAFNVFYTSSKIPTLPLQPDMALLTYNYSMTFKGVGVSGGTAMSNTEAPITWGTVSSNCSTSTNNLTKNNGSGSWNGGAMAATGVQTNLGTGGYVGKLRQAQPVVK